MDPTSNFSTGGSPVDRFVVRRLGRRSYRDALALQEHAARSVAAGGRDEVLILEHAPVISLGRGAADDQLVSGLDEIAAAGVSVERSNRGGGATYHGPGQLVVYPIVDLRRRHLGVRDYLRLLEATIIDGLRSEAVECFLRPGLTGVWTDAGKVAAIGIAVRRGISRHGLALNVDAQSAGFRHIVACGLREPVTSLRERGWCGDRKRLERALVVSLQSRLEAAAALVLPVPSSSVAAVTLEACR
jgi:lipoate-protein ligase B